MTFGEEGVSMTDDFTVHLFRWVYFGRARETSNLMVLYSEENLRYLLPKRAVPEGQFDALRALIHSHVPDCKFLLAPPAFPVLPKPVLPLAAST